MQASAVRSRPSMTQSYADATSEVVSEVIKERTNKAIARAVKEGDLKRLKDLVADDGDKQNLAMTHAILNAQIPVAEWLLECKIDINAQLDYLGRSPLMFATVPTVADKMIPWLVERKADVDQEDNDGWTPLLHAIHKISGESSVAQLIQHKANVARKFKIWGTDKERTPLEVLNSLTSVLRDKENDERVRQLLSIVPVPVAPPAPMLPSGPTA